MKQNRILVHAFIFLLSWCAVPLVAAETPGTRIKAFCIDFNWGPGGPNGFAQPGLWAHASPAAHVKWYKDLGANVVQTFCVSCNGYAWYKNGVVPEQPGLRTDFLTEVVKLGHRAGMKVMGYFCIGANTRWGQEHPDQSYGTPSAPHIPFTRDYVDYVCAAVEDVLEKTGCDGFMVDWFFYGPYTPRAARIRWLPCEEQRWRELMGTPFPGKELVTQEQELQFKRRASARLWDRFRATAKAVNPDCILWLSCHDLDHPQIKGSKLLREVDWLMNEHPDPSRLARVEDAVGPHTRIIQCLCGWGDQHDAARVIDDPRYHRVGFYGFARPDTTSFPAVTRDKHGRLTGNARNIELMRTAFQVSEKNLPLVGEVFKIEDCTAFLILPEETGSGSPIPWVWYAPTLPGLPGKHETWMFERFLDNGLAIAGVDVGESYGSPAGRAVYSALYRELVENRGLARKPCLLARSRGGLMLYNWAVENPEAVACIAGIYPVCNLSSYPGLERACGAYGMTAAQLAQRLTEHNPIDRLVPLARAEVPIFHIHGDRDTVVPLDRNSTIVKERYDKLGGAMTLEIIAGQGHNLWSGWFQNRDLVDFVITHAKSISTQNSGTRDPGESANGVQEMYPSEENRTQSPGHTTYYIDPVNGRNRHSGRERKLAWRTFRHVNGLRLGPGDRVEIMRYDFYPTRALKRTYQISNTNDDPDTGKTIGILLEGAKHFRISGPDASLFYRGKMIEVCIDRCQDIEISDLHFDYHRPTVSEFTVTAVGDGAVDLQIHRDSQYRIDNGQIIWEGEVGRRGMELSDRPGPGTRSGP